MATPKKQAKPAAKSVKSLPKKSTKSASNVKGGRLTRGGDDDLDDLEVERLRAK